MGKLQKREALKGQTHTRGVSVSVSRAKDLEDTNTTLSFVFVSDDNAGQRFDWGSGEYYSEVLDVNGASTSRLNTFFKDHVRSVDSAVGKISNVRVDEGQLIGDVTFGSDDDSSRIFRKYNEGILTDVSIGYEIHDYEVTRGADNEQDTVTVTNFDIFEVSAVGVGFDSGAKKREDTIDRSPKMDEKQLERLEALEGKSKRNEKENAELRQLLADKDTAERKALDVEKQKLDAEKAEFAREKEINLIAVSHGERGAKVLASFDGKKPSVAEYNRALLDSFAGDTGAVDPKVEAQNSRAKMIDGMVDGLALRAGATIAEPSEGALDYRHYSLTDLAKELDPEGTRGMSKVEIAERSLVTGDFPLLLQSVGARVLVSEFEKQVGTYKAWMAEVDVPDFRTMTDITNSFGGGRLAKTLENGDLAEISGAEKAESWKIESFGNKFVLTREMLINDDLGAFTGLVATFGEMAQTTANGIAYDILQNKGDYSNYKMADGSGIYIAGRNNTATDALSSTALSAGRLAMSKHKSIDGVTPLRITPKYLVIPPALEVTAREILGASAKLGADNVAVPNVNQNLYEIVVDPEISSDTAWYLLAENKTFKMGFLAGTGRTPQLKTNDSTLMRTVFEGVFDIGVTVVDYRGIYRGNV